MFRLEHSQSKVRIGNAGLSITIRLISVCILAFAGTVTARCFLISSWSLTFCVALALIAVGIGGYAVSSFAAFIVEGNFNQFMRDKRIFKQIDQMNNHTILCGAGKVGRKAALELFKTRIPFVVIDQNPEVIETLLRDIEVPFIEGDATQNQVLELAGIGRAKGLVTALNDDKSNAFVVLSARETAAPVLDALLSGAQGHLVKGSSSREEIVTALHAVRRGASILSPVLAGLILDEVSFRHQTVTES